MGRRRATEQREVNVRKAELREMPEATTSSRFYIPIEIVPRDKVYRFVAVSVQGMPTPDKWTRRSRAGWKAVPRSRHVDLWPYVPMPGQTMDAYADVIFEGGQILMECDKKIFDKHRAKLSADSAESLGSIAWTGQQDAVMPRMDLGSSVNIERVTTQRNAAFKE